MLVQAECEAKGRIFICRLIVKVAASTSFCALRLALNLILPQVWVGGLHYKGLPRVRIATPASESTQDGVDKVSFRLAIVESSSGEHSGAQIACFIFSTITAVDHRIPNPVEW